MNRLHVAVYSMAGMIVDSFDLPVPITAELVFAQIVPGEMHGPYDVPCGHSLCRVYPGVAAECAAERAEKHNLYDGWAD